MKLPLFIYFILFLTLPIPKSFAQWEWIDPTPSGLTGRSITFVDSDNGFIVNDAELLRTTDAGVTWQIQQRIKEGNEIKFAEHTGFIIGDYGSLYKTLDRGESWQELKINTLEPLNSVFILHPDTIYLTGNKSFFSSYNGGTSWNATSLQKPEFNHLTITKSFFHNSLIGHIVSNIGTILKTKDGGKTWYITEKTNLVPSDYFTIYFINKEVGFASRELGEVFKTTDGGETWAKLDQPHNPTSCLSFYSGTPGNAEGELKANPSQTSGRQSCDIGDFFEQPNSNNSPHSIYFSNPVVGYRLLKEGGIMKTADGGKTWTPSGYKGDIYSNLQFFTNHTGYAIGSQVYKTTDNGDSWQPILAKPDPDSWFKFGHFVSVDTGFVLALSQVKVGNIPYDELHTLYRTADGGVSWTMVESAIRNVTAFNFVNSKYGFISTKSNGFYATENGGQTWELVSLLGQVSDLHFIDSKRGFALVSGKLYQTTDGGHNWYIKLEDQYNFKHLYFIDEKLGFVSLEYNSILKTKDGGNTWQKIDLGYERIRGIAFHSENIGYVWGDLGKNFATSDGGITWQSMYQSFAIHTTVTQLYITPDKYIFAVGEKGVVLRRELPVKEYVLQVLPPIEVKEEVATLQGVVGSNSELITNLRFEYGTDGANFHSITIHPDQVEPQKAMKVFLPLVDLTTNTLYYIRLKASYKGGEIISPTINFKTTSAFDIVYYSVNALLSRSATLQAQLTSNSEEITKINFEYGTDGTFPSQIEATPTRIGPGERVIFNGKVTQLEPETTYYYRTKFSYKGKQHYSEVQRFTTRPDCIITIYRPLFRNAGTETSLIAHLLSYNGPVTDVTFEYGLDRTYTQKIPVSHNPILQETLTEVSVSVKDLVPEARYFVRVKALQNGRVLYSPETMFRASGGILIETIEAESVTESSAVMAGLFAPQGGHVVPLDFEYGETEFYGNTLRANPNFKYGNQTGTLKASIHNLKASTTYHYRAKTVLAGVPIYGSDQTFTTASITGFPIVEAASVRIHPNPSPNRVRITHQKIITQVEVYNQLGKLVMVKTPAHNDFEVDLAAQAPGIYYFKIFILNNIEFKKVVKL